MFDEDIEGLRLIRKDELVKIVSLSYSTISRMEKKGEFPRRIQIGSRRVAWRLCDVRGWINYRDQGNYDDYQSVRLVVRPMKPQMEPQEVSVSQAAAREAIRVRRVGFMRSAGLLVSSFNPDRLN
jgi:prophage regulatory protein